jgi:hypothetical protein
MSIRGFRFRRLKHRVKNVDAPAMCLIRHMQARLAVLASNERGMAVPLVLSVMVIGLGFSAAAITVSVTAQSGTNRDQQSKDAFAIADAGAQRALLTQNKIEATNQLPCVGKDAASGNYTAVALQSTDGWCTKVGGVDSAGALDENTQVGGGFFRYWIYPCVWGIQQYSTGLGCAPYSDPSSGWYKVRGITIISVGCSNTSSGCATGVSRRVETAAAGTTGSLTSTDTHGAIGLEEVTLDGNSEIDADVKTNGNVTIGGRSQVCGSIQVGRGYKNSVNTSGQTCPPKVTEGTVSADGVKIPCTDDTGAISSSSCPFSNDRLTNINQPGADTMTGSGGFGWIPSNRTQTIGGTLTLSAGTEVTLGGGDYVFCRMILGGHSHLIMAASATVRIFFDSPERCGLTDSPAVQISVAGTASIISRGYDPPDSYNVLQMFMLGSNSRSTQAVFTGTSDVNHFQLYAPLTDVFLQGTTDYIGDVTGKTLHLAGNPILKSDPNIPSIGGDPNFIVYNQRFYVDCHPTATYPPTDLC